MKVVGSLIHDCETGLNKPEVGHGDLTVGSEVVRAHCHETRSIYNLLKTDSGWKSVTDYLIIKMNDDEEEYNSHHLSTLEEIYQYYKGE